MANVAVIYYSSTGNMHTLAQAVAQGVTDDGGEVRMHRVPETAPDEAIDKRPEWREHLEATRDVPLATLDDLDWSDAYILGTPSRYGNVSAQLKAFIDSVSPLWQAGKLADKVASGFTGATTAHGGLESTLLTLYNVFIHWGAVIAPPGYTDPVQMTTGTPYGTAHWDQGLSEPPGEDILAAARFQGRRTNELADKLRA